MYGRYHLVSELRNVANWTEIFITYPELMFKKGIEYLSVKFCWQAGRKSKERLQCAPNLGVLIVTINKFFKERKKKEKEKKRKEKRKRKKKKKEEKKFKKRKKRRKRKERKLEVL